MIFLLEAIMMGLVLWQTLGHSFEASREQSTANEQTMLDVLGGISRVALLTEEYADLQPYLENLLNDPRVVRIVLADALGRVVAGTRPEDVGSSMPALTNEGDYFWRSREITNAAGQLGVLALELSNASLLKAYNKARNLGLSIAALGMAVIAIAGVFAGFLLTRRLERVTVAAQRFARGELAVETGVHGHDELGELAESFDDMARRLAEDQHYVQESEHYHRALFEQSPIGLALCRMNGELVDINPAYADILGRSVEETLNLTYWDITPRKYAEDEQRQLERLNKSGRYGPYEKEYTHKDGHLVPVRLHSSILEKEGETFIWSSVEDITERKQAEEREASLGRILDDSLNEIYIFDADTLRFVQVNRGAMLNLGYSMEELRKLTASDLKPEYTHTEFMRLLEPLRNGEKEKLRFNTIHQRKDGSLYPVEVHLQPSTFESAPAFVAIILDVTERNQAEDTLRRTQKMEAIGRLSGGVAHDFNNQLGIIIGYLDYLKNHFTVDEKPRQWVETASKATLRCMDLTRQLLTFSRGQSKEKTVVNLNTSLQDMENVIARSVTPEVEVQYFLAGDLGSTRIDPGEFQDAVLNLVINARDAMPGGGKLLIETTNKHLDTDYVTLNPEVEPGDYVQLMLSDTGTGMDKETLEHVFEPFFTTKPAGQGTGLGMAMVYGFVKRYDGHIKVYSEPGVGTAIRLYLPGSIAPKSAINAKSARLAELPAGSETILVVEDEDDLLQLADQYLSSLGYRTRLAENAAQALEILAAEGDIDLLFSDVVMPGGMNGFELAQRATEQRPDLKILLTSGYTARTIANNGLARFSAHLLSKPYRKDDLAQRIRLVLNEVLERAVNPLDVPDIKVNLAGRTVLLIDDEESVRELFTLNLERLGCKTVPACNGDEAIALYRQSLESGQTIDVTILDLTLPGSMGGKQVAEKIRALDPQARIIVASGHSEGPEMTRYRDYGFQGALEKNFNREKIKQVLEQVLTSG